MDFVKGELDSVKGEPIEVQAAYRVLSDLPFTMWADWLISEPDRRLLAARWYAHWYKRLEKMLTSNDFSPE